MAQPDTDADDAARNAVRVPGGVAASGQRVATTVPVPPAAAQLAEQAVAGLKVDRASAALFARRACAVSP